MVFKPIGEAYKNDGNGGGYKHGYGGYLDRGYGYGGELFGEESCAHLKASGSGYENLDKHGFGHGGFTTFGDPDSFCAEDMCNTISTSSRKR